MPLVVAAALVIDRTVNAKQIFGDKVGVRTKPLRLGTNQLHCC
jgi:hypothetical protein